MSLCWRERKIDNECVREILWLLVCVREILWLLVCVREREKEIQ